MVICPHCGAFASDEHRGKFGTEYFFPCGRVLIEPCIARSETGPNAEHRPEAAPPPDRARP